MQNLMQLQKQRRERMNQIEFARAMKRLSSFYFKDFSTDDLMAWYELFKDIKVKTLEQAITDIVKESKFMPNINQLLDKCKSTTNSFYLAIISKMYEDGYFKQGIVELDPEHEMRNYEKACRWVEGGIIPGFLKEDMKKYMLDDNKQIKVNKSFLIEDQQQSFLV